MEHSPISSKSRRLLRAATIASIAAIFTACGGQPSAESVRAELDKAFQDKPSSITELQAEITERPDGSYSVRFHGKARLDEPLYEESPENPLAKDFGAEAISGAFELQLRYLNPEEQARVERDLKQIHRIASEGAVRFEIATEPGVVAPFAGGMVARKSADGWQWESLVVNGPRYDGVARGDLKPFDEANGTGQYVAGSAQEVIVKRELEHRMEALRRRVDEEKEIHLQEAQKIVGEIEGMFTSSRNLVGDYVGYRNGALVAEVHYRPETREVRLVLSNPDQPGLSGEMRGRLKQPVEAINSIPLELLYEGTPVSGAPYPFEIERARYQMDIRDGQLHGAIGGGSRDEFFLKPKR